MIYVLFDRFGFGQTIRSAVNLTKAILPTESKQVTETAFLVYAKDSVIGASMISTLGSKLVIRTPYLTNKSKLRNCSSW